jgi:GTP cyclohydrolase I
MALNDIYAKLLATVPDLSPAQRSKTSQRAGEAFEFLTQGYTVDLKALTQNSLYPCPDSGQVLVKNIEFISLCEHHLLPMLGTCHIAYLPQGQVLGLGKISEIVQMFSRRLQLQEKLTSEIAQAMMQATQASGVAVMIEAKHLCTALLGVEKTNQVVATTCFLGSLSQAGAALFR